MLGNTMEKRGEQKLKNNTDKIYAVVFSCSDQNEKEVGAIYYQEEPDRKTLEDLFFEFRNDYGLKFSRLATGPKTKFEKEGLKDMKIMLRKESIWFQ